MKLADFKKMILGDLEKEITLIGFKKKVVFTKIIKPGVKAHIGLNKATYGNDIYLCINPVMMVTYESIKTIFNLLFRLNQKKHPCPTISSPIGSLIQGKYKEWEFSSETNIKEVIHDLIKCVETYGIPWIEKMGNIFALHEAFKNEKFAMPFDRLYNFPILLMLMDDKETLDWFISDRYNFLEKKNPKQELERFKVFINGLYELKENTPELFINPS